MKFWWNKFLMKENLERRVLRQSKIEQISELKQQSKRLIDRRMDVYEGVRNGIFPSH